MRTAIHAKTHTQVLIARMDTTQMSVTGLMDKQTVVK